MALSCIILQVTKEIPVGISYLPEEIVSLLSQLLDRDGARDCARLAQMFNYQAAHIEVSKRLCLNDQNVFLKCSCCIVRIEHKVNSFSVCKCILLNIHNSKLLKIHTVN